MFVLRCAWYESTTLLTGVAVYNIDEENIPGGLPWGCVPHWIHAHPVCAEGGGKYQHVTIRGGGDNLYDEGEIICILRSIMPDVF